MGRACALREGKVVSGEELLAQRIYCKGTLQEHAPVCRHGEQSAVTPARTCCLQRHVCILDVGHDQGLWVRG